MTGRLLRQSPAALLRRRQALVKQMEGLEALVLRGSLIERYKRCSHAGCKCQKGKGHGPKYYLSVSHTGARPEMDYVPGEYREQVTDYLANFQKLRQLLEQICSINRELLRRRLKF
jgi:hypothetical protein